MENYLPTSIDGYLELFFKRKRLFYVPFFSVLALTAVLYPFLPRVYESTSILEIEDKAAVQAGSQLKLPSKPSVDKKLKALSSQILGWENLAHVANVAGMTDKMTSQSRFEALIEDLRKKITITQIPPNLIQITYEGTNPVRVQTVAKTLTENLMAFNKKLNQEEADKTIQFVSEQLRMYKDKLQSSEQTLLANKVRGDLDIAVRRREMLLNQLSQMDKTIRKESAREQNPVTAKLRQELSEARVQLNRLLVDAKDDHPLVNELRQKISDLQQRINDENESAPQAYDINSTPNPAYQSTILQLKELYGQISDLENRLAELESEKFKMTDLAEKDLIAMEQDKSVNQDIYKTLLIRLENAQISKRQDQIGEDLVLIEPARLPMIPARPKLWVVILIAIVLALMAGVGTVFCREMIDTSLRGIDDAREVINLPLLATIPKVELNALQYGPLDIIYDGAVQPSAARGKNGKNHHTTPVTVVGENTVAPQIVTFHDPGSEVTEQYRLLRTYLLYMHKKKSLQTMMVTSTLETEGKTTTSTNLAVSMAQELSGHTLLIDADLRKGTVAKVLGLRQTPGLSDVLKGSVDLEQALVPSQIPRLTVLPCGNLVRNSAGLLASGRMEPLLHGLKSRFDRIIIDTPPVLSLADVPVLIPMADGILFVAQVGKSRRKLIQEALETLQETHTGNVLGFVLTQVDQYLPKYLQQYLGNVRYYAYGGN
jgi:polysaccharide biosynthesis transport protein